jgi:hypothetical protein
MSYWALEMWRLTMSLMRCSTRLIGDDGERSFTDSSDVWLERNGQDRTVEASPSRFLPLRRSTRQGASSQLLLGLQGGLSWWQEDMARVRVLAREERNLRTRVFPGGGRCFIDAGGRRRGSWHGRASGGCHRAAFPIRRLKMTVFLGGPLLSVIYRNGIRPDT